ncbi:MAG: sulfite exporter TauE/SafE family protein [Rhodovibrionaceae bacterium]
MAGIAQHLNDLSIFALAIAALAFFCGGVVKGATGVGLPLVALPIMSFAFSVPESVAMMTVPILVSNIVQAFSGGRFLYTFRRFWPLLLAVLVTMAFTVKLLSVADPRLLSAFLGGILLISAGAMLFQPEFHLKTQREGLWSAGVGVVGGLIGGLTSLYGLPIIHYLLALRLDRVTFVSCIAVIYVCGSATLMVLLAGYRVLGAQEALLSVAGLIPVGIGMLLGNFTGSIMSERRFRLAVLCLMVVASVNLIQKAVF